MTPEELDEARAKEALRIWDEEDGVTDEGHAVIAARLARENWTPPKPVDPDLLAFREFASKAARSASLAESYRDGDMDSCASAHLFLAGARMAREQEQERAKVLVGLAEELVGRFRILRDSLPAGVRVQLGVKWDIDGALAKIVKAEIAKYRGEA